MLKRVSCYYNVFMFGLQVKEKVSTMVMVVGKCSCKYVELAVTDGLKFWDWAGRHQALTL
jgi:hypothetical protein